MPNPDPLSDLALLIRSHYAIIILETSEEERAETLLLHLSDALKLPFFTWTTTKGLRRNGAPDGIYGTSNPSTALSHIESSRYPALYMFRGFGNALKDPTVAEALSDASGPFESIPGALILVGTDLEMPETLKPRTANLKLPPPRPDEYRALLANTVRDLSGRMPVQVTMTAQDVNRLLANLTGLTLMEAQKILTKAIVEDGKLDPADIQKVIDAKKAIVEREGLLEYSPAQEKLSDIADLAGLKGWLAKRREFLTAPEQAAKYGLSFPKGVLLLGVQGCGKSLCAKAVASEWGLPLLKLDPSNLYNKYIGESEKNFKRAMTTAERMAPVILWIDEIEKAFASSDGGDDSAVTRRILGTFLAWMQDRKGDVFILATANDIQRLPPEFIRKGRFDEIFFVDLPVPAARRAIWEIHLKKRKQDPARFNLPPLVEATDGFSGAEIEQVIVSGLYSAFSLKAELTQQMLVKEIQQTKPLSVTMAEKVEALREWAKDKTVSAQ